MHLLETPGDDPARVGFVVSRSVGGAVVRATVKRRLRHLCAARLADLPDGSLLVVRARAAAAHADSAALSRDVSSALVRLLGHPASALGPSRTAPAVVTGS